MSGVNKTRERILDVSADLFRRQGMAGTGIKQILRDADAPFGSLYHHFPGGKDELAAETIKRAGAQSAFSRERFDVFGIHVEDHALMAGAHQAADHVSAHSSKADHS